MTTLNMRKCVLFGCHRQADVVVEQEYLTNAPLRHRLCIEHAKQWLEERPDSARCIGPYRPTTPTKGHQHGR
jgi:hypothetical protein